MARRTVSRAFRSAIARVVRDTNPRMSGHRSMPAAGLDPRGESLNGTPGAVTERDLAALSRSNGVIPSVLTRNVGNRPNESVSPDLRSRPTRILSIDTGSRNPVASEVPGSSEDVGMSCAVAAAAVIKAAATMKANWRRRTFEVTAVWTSRAVFRSPRVKLTRTLVGTGSSGSSAQGCSGSTTQSPGPVRLRPAPFDSSTWRATR
jgi:hypothetical protein